MDSTQQSSTPELFPTHKWTPPTGPVPTIVTERRIVPGEQPITECDARIAIIGEAPGEEEENHRRPFIGKSGNFLWAVCDEFGIKRYNCYVGNICQVRPPGNNINLFDWNGPEIQSGLQALRSDLDQFNPNICLLLGNTPLHAAKSGNKPPRRVKGKLDYEHKITGWRGSLFAANVDSPFSGRKCIATFHPANVLREYSNFPLLKFDIGRAASEARTPTLALPERELLTHVDAGRLCFILDSWPSGQRCSLDIEGRLRSWTCVSFAARPSKSITIVWHRYSESECIQILRAFARLMWRTDVPKVLQNQLYDNFVLCYGYALPIRNVVEDIMIKGWAIYAELPRALGVQASIWTRQPHWKDDTMYSGGEGLYVGCAIDSAVTMEICLAQDSVLEGVRLAHYRKMIEIQNPFLFMELRGIRYDQENVNKKLAQTNAEIVSCKERLLAVTGHPIWGPKGSLSSKQLAKCLYEERGYPPQYKKEFGRKTESLTTDNEALLNLKKHRDSDEFLNDILLHRHLEGIRETLSITPDEDGRVRCGYSLEAETGRVKCYTSPTGSGGNLQTIQKDLRDSYTADPDYDFFQCDLEGADGWTVAAHAARLGDRTMLEDYLAGMKPAKIIAMMYALGPDINELDRESLKFCHDRIFPIVQDQVGKWVYMGSKRVQHGSSYLMGILTMILNILRDSYKESGKPIYMEPKIAKALQDLFFRRYPGVQLWQNYCENKLVADGELSCPSGHTRVFFGRRYGSDLKATLREFLAHEPQNNTTWATNVAMLNLWNDPDNRRADGSLIIEPLHQVHDALCGQWPRAVRDWARAKVRSYFDNEIVIAGIPIRIPFDGAYGPSWGMVGEKDKKTKQYLENCGAL